MVPSRKNNDTQSRHEAELLGPFVLQDCDDARTSRPNSRSDGSTIAEGLQLPRIQVQDPVLSKAVVHAEPEIYSFVNKNALIVSQPANGPNIAWVNAITHVDDTLTVSNHRALQLLYCREYLKVHNGTLQTSPTSFVGITWKRTVNGSLQLGTPASAKKLKEMSKLNNCHQVHYPIHDYVTTQAKEKGSNEEEQAKIDDKVTKVLKDSKVREQIGTLAWMANFKSTLMFGVRQIQRCVGNPQQEHLDQLKHMVKYTLSHPGGDNFPGVQSQPYAINNHINRCKFRS